MPNETIKMKHVAMVNPQNIEVALTDEMMQKWIGSREDYFFRKEVDDVTTLEVVMLADEAFEEMMNAWSLALQLFRNVCEA